MLLALPVFVAAILQSVAAEHYKVLLTDATECMKHASRPLLLTSSDTAELTVDEPRNCVAEICAPAGLGIQAVYDGEVTALGPHVVLSSDGIAQMTLKEGAVNDTLKVKSRCIRLTITGEVGSVRFSANLSPYSKGMDTSLMLIIIASALIGILLMVLLISCTYCRTGDKKKPVTSAGQQRQAPPPIKEKPYPTQPSADEYNRNSVYNEVYSPPPGVRASMRSSGAYGAAPPYSISGDTMQRYPTMYDAVGAPAGPVASGRR